MKDEKVDLRNRTKAFALRALKLYAALPKKPDAQVLGKQLLRSRTSVGANYREAYRARSDADFVAKFGDCLKELDETTYWLELLAESGILPADRLALMQDEATQLIAIFTTIQRSWQMPISSQKGYVRL